MFRLIHGIQDQRTGLHGAPQVYSRLCSAQALECVRGWCSNPGLLKKLFDGSNHSRHATPYVGEQCRAIACGLSHDLFGLSSRSHARRRGGELSNRESSQRSGSPGLGATNDFVKTGRAYGCRPLNDEHYCRSAGAWRLHCAEARQRGSANRGADADASRKTNSGTEFGSESVASEADVEEDGTGRSGARACGNGMPRSLRSHSTEAKKEGER